MQSSTNESERLGSNSFELNSRTKLDVIELSRIYFQPIWIGRDLKSFSY